MTAPRTAAAHPPAVEGPGRVTPHAARATLAKHITEDDLLGNVIHAARIHGWLVHHCRAARTADGWRTPVQGNRGFPDLVLAKPGRLVLAELKAQRGRLSSPWDRPRCTSGGRLTGCPGRFRPCSPGRRR